MDLNFINLVIGDWSGDGHGLTETVMIKTSLTAKQINTAYNAGCDKIGFNLITSVCRHYDETRLDYDYYKKLKESGFDFRGFGWDKKTVAWIKEFESGQLDDSDGNEPELYLNQEQYLAIYLFFIKIGNPDFNCLKIDGSEVRIGGYGLFSC